ncbi:zonular occludens toxin domain-containing protein [Salinivibrio sp. IB872]|uniref:zonular occludens toxin domain-containing protein n=1 Tax=Salinivibrio sp. IB872 TaxID=1766123 RepID=UPI001F527AFE|nr:zonular occludens toxin domain-containing protein [Salinivibrio sp. IB872]
MIVIDEIQDIWGTRSAGASVPKAVEEYATHRHKGFDLVLISQDFRDCDVFIRRRIGNHKHYLNYGLKYLKVWEDHKLIPTDDSKALWRLGSKKITKDKRFFGVYLSAVLHTHKPKLPRKVKLALYVAAFSFCAMAAGILFLVNKFTSDTPETAISDTVTHSETATLSDNSLANTDFKLFTPRVDALPFTAPVFDDRIARGELDIPQLFCYAVDMSCKCYTQQGTRYSVSHSECLNIAQFGTFNYFKNQDERTR